MEGLRELRNYSIVKTADVTRLAPFWRALQFKLGKEPFQ
jgi:hypothetical protein